MTYSIDTLIANSKAVSAASATNITALKTALQAFVGAQYPVDKSDYDLIARDYKTADYRYRQPTDLAEQSAAMPADGYADVFLPLIPDWVGVEQFKLDTGTGSTSPFEDFQLWLGAMFPTAAEVAAVTSALQSLIDSPPSLDSAVDASSAVTAANKVTALADLPLLFSARGMPTPTGYANYATAHVTALHVERDYDRADDRVYDDTISAELLMARIRGFASAFTDMMGARATAINAVGAYLDAVTNNTQMPYDIAEQYAKTELGLYAGTLDEAMAKLGFNDMLRNSLLDYFKASSGYQRSAQQFVAESARLNTDARGFMTTLMGDTGKMRIGASAAEATAYSRKAAASIAALGTILSSAVSTFG